MSIKFHHTVTVITLVIVEYSNYCLTTVVSNSKITCIRLLILYNKPLCLPMYCIILFVEPLAAHLQQAGAARIIR